MTWKDEVRKVIKENWKVGEEFTYSEVIKFEDYFSSLYPNNSHVREKISQILQQLRDDKTIEFVDYDGTYKRLK